jgi:hypothetical protein
METEHIVIASALLTAVGWLITHWMISILRRIQDLENRAGTADVQNAVFKANMEHIIDTLDETREDVKKILQLNGKRTTG